jgi:O-antigen/teichoic acid export membrane protein
MPSIQRQSILSSIFTYVGFVIGAANLFIIQRVLAMDQIGLTRVVTDFSLVAASLAMFGSTSVFSKFFPYYRHYLPAKKNDLVFLVTAACGIGLLIVLTLIYLLKPQIIFTFGRNNQEIFTRFYWILFPYIICWMAFSAAEPFFWVCNKSVIYNLLKETFFRLFTSVLLLLLYYKLIHFTGYAYSFAYIYLLPALVSVIYLYRSKKFAWYPHLSKLTLRLKGKMISFSMFLFFTGLLTLIVRVCDTLFLASLNGFEDATLFMYPLYFSQIMDVPNRAITGGAVPKLSEYWRTRNMKGITSIYKKSAINLTVAGLALGGLIIINLPNAIRFMEPEYSVILLPAIILIISQLVNLSTGINALIIHTSNRWRFDFISTMIWSVVSVPLNFFLIKYMGLNGAAIAMLISVIFYNTYRWYFLYSQFKFQPFSLKNMEVLLIGAAAVSIFYVAPRLPNLYLDAVLRSPMFLAVFAWVVIKRNYSEEVNALWSKWSKKLFNAARR